MPSSDRESSQSSSMRHFNPPSRQPPSYFNAAISIFDRPKKRDTYLKPPPAHQPTWSSENLLKRQPIVAATPLPSVHEEGNRWSPGCRKRIPFRAALALVVVLLCIVADAVILYKSDGMEVDRWKPFSPAVYLAILSSVANSCLQFAQSEGVTIAWWRKALKGGTLYDLSRLWESGDSVLSASTSGRGFNLVALATVIVTAVVIDGPLLQKASTVVTKPITVNITVNAPIAQEIPYGFTAFGDIQTGERLVMREPFSAVVNNYSTNTPIITGFEGCQGTCSGIVKAAGFALNCSSDTVFVNTTIQDKTASDVFVTNFAWRPATAVAKEIGTLAHYSKTVDVWPYLPLITYNLSYTTGRTAPALFSIGSVFSSTPGGNGNCNGTMVRQTCSLLSATLEYPIRLVNNTVQLAGNSMSYAVDHFQAYGNESDWLTGPDPNPMTFSTLGGLAIAAQNLFSSNASQLAGSIQMTGPLSSQSASFGTGNTSYEATQNACAINWVDPTEQIMDALNEIMFRTSLAASTFPKYKIMKDNSSGSWWRNYYEAYPLNVSVGDTGVPVPQTIQMQQTSDITVFQSHYSFLAGALGVLLLGVMVVIPTFIGFWELGRDISLNPLEIAKAFNAHALESEGSNSSAKRMNEGLRNKEIKYGEICDGNPDALGLVGDRASTRFRGRRLELANPSRVREPEVGAVYS